MILAPPPYLPTGFPTSHHSFLNRLFNQAEERNAVEQEWPVRRTATA